MDEWTRRKREDEDDACGKEKKMIKSEERKLETMKRIGGNWKGNEIEMKKKGEKFRTGGEGGTKSLETNLMTRKYSKKKHKSEERANWATLL